MNQLELILPFFFAADVLATYLYFCFYKKIKPKDKDWAEAEFNALTNLCWRKWGLHKGTRISTILISPVVLLIMYAVAFKDPTKFLFGFLVGMYSLVFISHYMGFKYLKKQKAF